MILQGLMTIDVSKSREDRIISNDPQQGGGFNAKPYRLRRLAFCTIPLTQTSLRRGLMQKALQLTLKGFPLVGKTGFEPATPWSQTRCATGLRYFP